MAMKPTCSECLSDDIEIEHDQFGQRVALRCRRCLKRVT